MNRTQVSAVFFIGWSAQAIFLFVVGAEFGWMFWVYLFGLVTACAAAWIGSAPSREARRLAKANSSIAAIEQEVSHPLLDVVKAAEKVVVDGWLETPEGEAWVKRRKEVLATEARGCGTCRELEREAWGRYELRFAAELSSWNGDLRSRPIPRIWKSERCRCPEHTFDAHREMAKTFPAVRA